MTQPNDGLLIDRKSFEKLAEDHRRVRARLSPITEVVRRRADNFVLTPYIVTERQAKGSIFGENNNVFIDSCYGAGTDTGDPNTAKKRAVFKAKPYDSSQDLVYRPGDLPSLDLLTGDEVYIASRMIQTVLFTGQLFFAGAVTGYNYPELGSTQNNNLAKEKDQPVGDVVSGPIGNEWTGTITTEPTLTPTETANNIVCVDVNFFPRYSNPVATLNEFFNKRMLTCRVKAVNDTGTKLKSQQYVILQWMAPGYSPNWWTNTNEVFPIRWRISEYRCP